jgi:hypothetical protein
MLCLLLAICGGVGSRESEGDWGYGKDVCCVVFGSEKEMLEVSASEIRRVSESQEGRGESQDGLFVDLVLVRRASPPLLLTRDRWLGLERRGGGIRVVWEYGCLHERILTYQYSTLHLIQSCVEGES